MRWRQSGAALDGEVSYDRLHHFVGSGVWDEAPLEAALPAEADRLVGGDDAWRIIEDMALPKKGQHSVGMAPQYASTPGKNANCQTLVSVMLASREMPVMVALRLFLPQPVQGSGTTSGCWPNATGWKLTGVQRSYALSSVRWRKRTCR